MQVRVWGTRRSFPSGGNIKRGHFRKRSVSFLKGYIHSYNNWSKNICLFFSSSDEQKQTTEPAMGEEVSAQIIKKSMLMNSSNRPWEIGLELQGNLALSVQHDQKFQ